LHFLSERKGEGSVLFIRISLNSKTFLKPFFERRQYVFN